MQNINENKRRLYSGTRAALDLFICPLHFATNWLQYASMALTCWVSPIIISPIYVVDIDSVIILPKLSKS